MIHWLLILNSSHEVICQHWLRLEWKKRKTKAAVRVERAPGDVRWSHFSEKRHSVTQLTSFQALFWAWSSVFHCSWNQIIYLLTWQPNCFSLLWPWWAFWQRLLVCILSYLLCFLFATTCLIVFFPFTFCLLFLKGLKCYKCVSSSKSSSFSVNFDSCQQGIGLFMEQEECSFPFTYCAVIRTNDQFSGVPSVSRTCSIYVPPIAGFTSVCSSDLCNNSKLARVQHFYIN